MGLFSKDIKTMENLLLHTLQDIYYAEHQILRGTSDHCFTAEIDREGDQPRSDPRAQGALGRNQEADRAA
jgi:hypothetical protein